MTIFCQNSTPLKISRRSLENLPEQLVQNLLTMSSPFKKHWPHHCTKEKNSENTKKANSLVKLLLFHDQEKFSKFGCEIRNAYKFTFKKNITGASKPVWKQEFASRRFHQDGKAQIKNVILNIGLRLEKFCIFWPVSFWSKREVVGHLPQLIFLFTKTNLTGLSLGSKINIYVPSSLL